MMSKLAIGEDKHNLLNVFTLWAYYGEGTEIASFLLFKYLFIDIQ